MKKEARLFKSLADETRLKILWLLMMKEELCVCDFMEILGITQSKASRHLRYLSNLGWVMDRRAGVWNYRRMGPSGSTRSAKWRIFISSKKRCSGCLPPERRPAGPSRLLGLVASRRKFLGLCLTGRGRPTAQPGRCLGQSSSWMPGAPINPRSRQFGVPGEDI